MTLIIIFNAILAVAIVGAIAGGHVWAILGPRRTATPGAAPASPEFVLAGLPLTEPAIA